MISAPYCYTATAAPDPLPADPPARRPGGWFARRLLSDGRELSVWVNTRGGATLCLGGLEARHYADGWVYGSLESAVEAFWFFDPRFDREPLGWDWHPPTGRRGAGTG